MKFGLFYLPTYMPDRRDVHAHLHNIVEQVEYADRIGIDYAWMVEHHFVRHGGLLPAHYAFLCFLAARTENIRLGTGATVLPLNDPVRVAEQAATLDQLSKGRLDFGVGRGFIRDEFEAFGVPMRESRERVEEGGRAHPAGVDRRAARVRIEVPAEDVGPHGAAAGLPEAASADMERVPDVAREFRVDRARGPQPPLCRLSRRSSGRRREDRLVPCDALEKHGKSAADHEICCVYHAHFLERGDDAALKAAVDGPMAEYARAGIEAASKPPDPEAYKGYQRREAGQQELTFERYFPGRVLMGGPEQAVERIRELRDVGITQIGMLVDFGSLAQEEIMRSLEIFGREVLPKVRDL